MTALSFFENVWILITGLKVLTFLKYYPPEVYLLLGISMAEVKPVVTGKDGCVNRN